MKNRTAMLLFAMSTLGLGACHHHGGTAAKPTEAEALAGDWHVFQDDAQVGAYHLRLVASGNKLVVNKIYDQDSMSGVAHKRGESEKWGTLTVEHTRLGGQCVAPDGKTTGVAGIAQDDSRGMSIHFDNAGHKTEWELRR